MRRLLIARCPTSAARPLSTLHPQVALRPEPFGALAYHYGNRKLVFLKHPDVVRVVRVRSTTTRRSPTRSTPATIAEARWPAFERALASLIESEMLA